MKIDLDELERKTRDEMGHDYALGDHPAANHEQTLALIRRIRELEGAGRTLEHRARFGIDDDRKLAELEAALAILEKGAVLP